MRSGGAVPGAARVGPEPAPGSGEEEPGNWASDDVWVPGDELDPASSGSAPEPESEVESEPGVRRQRRGPWGRLASRWVPESLRDSRVDPGRRATVLLVAVAALAAVIAAVGVWRSRPDPRPVTAVALPAASSSAAMGGPVVGGATGAIRSLAAGPSAEPMVVAVTGWVVRPGLVRLPTGSRVADALTSAGGTKAGADLTGLNLAERLSDGESVVVAGPGAPSAAPGGSGVTGDQASAASSGATAVIDLNTADAAALDGLPGVGPVTAANIVAWRQKNGKFTSLDQLQEIPGIGPAKFAQLAPHLRL